MFKQIDIGIASNIHNIKKWPQKCHSGGETGIYHEKNTISLKVMNSHANPISVRQWWCLLCYHTQLHTNLEGKKSTLARPSTPCTQKLSQNDQIRAKILSNQDATPYQIYHHNTPCQYHYCQYHKKSQYQY